MGKRIGSYELKAKLGKGTFGTVFLGKHIPSKNKIAIKMINRQGLKPEQQNRLEQEILCQRSVDSDYVVKLLDVQKTDNNFYLILEFCSGGDLGQFIQQNGPVDEAVAQRWMQHLAEGFKALRSKNIIHRDLKLQNILMTEASTSAVLKLADFGMSRFLDDDLAQSWLGTPLYMAPEVFRVREGYDSKADVWSLGVVLYEMLTGEAPFNARRKEEIPTAQRHLKPFPTVISPPCKDLLEKMLAYDPKQRISFDEIFEHPFIAGVKEDNSSLMASKGSSDAYLSSDVTPNVPIPEQLESPMSTDDFVLLDNEETVPDFVFIAKDNHPAINIAEVMSSVEEQLETIMIILKFAEKIKSNNEIIGSFAVYVKAVTLMENLLNFSQQMINKYNLIPGSYPSFFEQHDRVKRLFLENQDKTEELCKIVDHILSSGDPKYATFIDSIGKQGLADSLLYNYTISLCKEGAKDEFLRDYQKSKEKYQEAVGLLDHLCKGKDSNPSSEWDVVEAFRVETHRRLDTVNVKLTTA